MTAMRYTNEILVENLKGRHHLGDLEVERRIILKWVSNK
jgi:hypothetical protein